MDRDKIKEAWSGDIYHEEDISAMLDAFEELLRQHLAEHHSGFIVRPLSMDHADTNDPQECACCDQPPTGLSGTMEPERCECIYHREAAFYISAGWGYCPKCGKPLAGKEKKLPRYGEETEETHYVPVCKRCKVWESLLDKEYTEHTKEVADLRKRIVELEAQLQDEQERPYLPCDDCDD